MRSDALHKPITPAISYNLLKVPRRPPKNPPYHRRRNLSTSQQSHQKDVEEHDAHAPASLKKQPVMCRQNYRLTEVLNHPYSKAECLKRPAGTADWWRAKGPATRAFTRL
ncbi:hypothetical protein M404DRAFT_34162 [Pisolithus tinctorius Marx 270]|uniref:Uncharacterized protein n=1 Tax=Pisolithus tinctorius Marx 270 TaxID=870435 RepID=A0A0C3JCN1_PISTI|nr:hypothetical protein M404DRAFT_34162 [Pisolithus tinctorius Marx 270]